MIDKKRDGLLKTLFVIIGAIVSIAALTVLAYTLFKKYFEVTFDCRDDEDSEEENPFAEDEDRDFEPICCCDDEPEAKEDSACDCAENLISEA